jgi:hypothetical protein
MPDEDIRQQQLIRIKETLTNWFSLDELEDLSFDLGVDYSALGGSSKEGNVRNLIMELSRRGRLPQLIEACNERKPEIEWGVFTHLYQGHLPQNNSQSNPQASSNNNNKRLMFILLIVLAVIIVCTGAGAAVFFLTRTLGPSTPSAPIIEIPAQGTPSAETDGSQSAATSEVISTVPNVVETATLFSNIALQTVPPFTVKITDRYQGNPLDEANIRGGPGLEYEVVTRRGPNVEIKVWAYAYNSAGIPWYLIEIGEGKFGWISGVLVDIGPISLESIPVAATVPATYTLTPTATPTETPIPTLTPAVTPEA